MSTPAVQLGSDGFLYIRQMHFLKAGDREPMHSHQFDHYTHLSRGRATFWVKGERREFAAPCLVFIEANEPHEIVALEDDTVACCIHDVRNMQAGRILPG